MDYFTRADALGCDCGSYHLANLKKSMLSSVQHCTEIYELYLKAAESQVIDAYYPLAQCIYEGSGCAKDDAQALMWLHRIPSNHRDASRGAFLESRIYYWGLTNVPENRGKALTMLKQLAVAGNVQAREAQQRLDSGDNERDLEFVLDWCNRNSDSEFGALGLYHIYKKANMPTAETMLRQVADLSTKTKMALAKELYTQGQQRANQQQLQEAKALFQQIEEPFDDDGIAYYGELLMEEQSLEAMKKIRKLLKSRRSIAQDCRLLWLEARLIAFMRQANGGGDCLSDREIYCCTVVASEGGTMGKLAAKHFEKGGATWK